jgi:heavy metal sensor kinase
MSSHWPPWPQLSARSRLTLWYVALMATTLIGLGSLGLWLVRQELYHGADDLLRSKATAVTTEIEIEDGRLVFDNADDDHNDADEDASLMVGLDVVRIWDRDRNLIFSHPPISSVPELAPRVLNAVFADREQFERVHADGGSYRFFVQPIHHRGEIVGAVAVGRSEAEIVSLLDRLRVLGVAGLVAALVAAGVGGAFLATRALRPVDRITRAAEQIGAEDLSLRLDAGGVDDELGRLTSAFNGMIDRLERAFQRQQRFTADASHEIRTPLAVIRSLAEVALTSPRDEEYDARVYASICEESERLTHLVESLLTLARADEGHTPMLVGVDLDDVALDAAAKIVERARRQGVTLAVAPSDGFEVRGDSSLLTQLVLNLLDNALRHTQAGGRIALTIAPADGGVTLTVADTGSGIAPEHLPRLFERFYRVDQVRSRSMGGFGLGLAICEWIARVHAGRLSVESEVGVGTTFRLWLPLLTATPSTIPEDARDRRSVA